MLIVKWAMGIGILPLRAIAFQTMFLLLAIALEALILYRQLGLDYKTSARYATSLNLLSTVVGWLFFLPIQALLPEDLRVQLISYFFFERFFPNPWSASVAPIITVLGLGIFIGTFFIELKGLEGLELLLGKRKPEEAVEARNRARTFHQQQSQLVIFKPSNQAYAVLVANACSFSAILFLLLIRWLDQSFLRV